MESGPFFHARWALLGVLVAAGAPGALRADLAQSSPFLAPGSTGAGAQTGPNAPVELRGVMSTPGGTAYCLYDTAKRTSMWVGLNEGGHDFTVKAADAGGEVVTVDYQGRTLRLVLRTAKVASSGPAALAGGYGQGLPAGGVVLNPTPADEQRRLDAVAAEVRRRRMEREKAIQDAQASGRGPPGAPNR